MIYFGHFIDVIDVLDVIDVSEPALDETFLPLFALGQERDLLAMLILPGQVTSCDGRRVSFLKK